MPEHTARIRSAHLNRLQARLTESNESLVTSCRYESDLSTLPPPGKVALTFDDGPEPGQTEQILEVLNRHGVPATFFVIGEKAVRHAELVARIRAMPGLRVGSHSWSHPNFHDLPPDAQLSEISRGDEAISEAADPAASTSEGHVAPKLFRYPYGNSSCAGNTYLHKRGIRIVGWHVDSCDWAFDGDGSVTAQEALSCGVARPFMNDFVGHVLASVRAHRGGIVLMHEIHRNTVSKLDELVRRLQEEGYKFSTPDDPDFAADLR